jgi:hypothetical protein
MKISISNGLSFGYGIAKSTDLQKTFSSGFSNSISTSLGSYQVSVNHSLSYGHLSGDLRRGWVNNTADLNLHGAAWHNIESQFLLGYQSDIYSGDLTGYANHRQVRLQWSINSPMMYYYIPFTIAANGGASWLLGETVGRTFNWSGAFVSPQFFLRNLTFQYQISRAYDPTYQRQSITHTIDSHYQWRAIALELRFVHYQLVNSRSDFWITISRPF